MLLSKFPKRISTNYIPPPIATYVKQTPLLFLSSSPAVAGLIPSDPGMLLNVSLKRTLDRSRREHSLTLWPTYSTRYSEKKEHLSLIHVKPRSETEKQDDVEARLSAGGKMLTHSTTAHSRR